MCINFSSVDHNRVKLDTSMRDYVCEGDDYVNASYSKVI